MKNILLMNDLPGIGKVALSSMMPILSAMGHCVHNLPTALVSNTLDYGVFEILDTTVYMKNTIQVWKKLGFRFDCICTGFVNSLEQVPIMKEVIRENENRDVFVMVDPIMGDDGNLYNGIGVQTVEAMRELIKEAALITPNYTEACYLLNRPVEKTVSRKDRKELLDGLRNMGACSVVITSVPDEEGKMCIEGYSFTEKQYFSVPYESLPARYPGTGDTFSAVLVGRILNGAAMEEAVKQASNFVGLLMQTSECAVIDKKAGLYLEKYLQILYK